MEAHLISPVPLLLRDTILLQHRAQRLDQLDLLWPGHGHWRTMLPAWARPKCHGPHFAINQAECGLPRTLSEQALLL